MKEEIGPKLERLKQERMQFVEFQRVERELEHCRRIYVAWRYQKALQDSDDAENNVSKVKKDLENKQKSIKDGEEEVKRIEIEVVVLQRKRDEVSYYFTSSIFQMYYFYSIIIICICRTRGFISKHWNRI